MMAQQEYNGEGSLVKIGLILAREKPKSIFLVTGKKSYETSGAKAIVDQMLEGFTVTHFQDFEINPKIEDMKRGIGLFQRRNCDLVIAIGGGSVLDSAKTINILAANPEDPERYVTRQLKIEQRGKPLVAIPTTSGTGSEATHFAVVYINRTKYSLAHPEFILPNYVILDPQLTYNLPPNIVASTGLDALSHAIEAYWSILATEEAREFSRAAIPLILKHIKTAITIPTNHHAKQAMMTAANLAGKSINIAKTTAPHAISYTITSYFGIPHSHAVALTLGEILYFNYQTTPETCNDHRGADYVRRKIEEVCKMVGVATPIEFPAAWRQLIVDVGLEPSLVALGIKTEKDLDLIAGNFNQERGKNNPRVLTSRDIKAILERIR